MLEVLFAAEVLMVGILHPPPHRFFIRRVEGMTQGGQAHQQANRDARPTFFRVQLTKLAFEYLPVDQPAQSIQFMPVIKNIFQTVAEHVQLRTGNLLLRLHRKSPEIEGEKCYILQFIVLYFSVFIYTFQPVDGFSWTTNYWISGPGVSGKTTLIASYLKREKNPSTWYQVDALDADPATFFYYFSQALGFLSDSSEPLPLFTPEYLPHLDIFALRYFEQAFHHLPPKTWIIVDNFQDAPADSALEKILAVALRQVPPHITLAIISRNIPPPAMTRFLANRTMILIHWEQLSFTRKEVQAFLLHSGQSAANAELIDNLHQLTKGWISGIILWLLHHGNASELTDIPADRTRESFFDYFTAEILGKLSTDECAFFFSTAFLPSMTVETVETLTGKQADDLLERLHRNNYFLERRASVVPVYQYHPLFRSFLLSRAGNFFEKEELSTIQLRAAEILERHGLYEEAIRLFAETKSLQVH